MSFLRATAECRSPDEAIGRYPLADAEEAELLEMVGESVRRFRDAEMDGARHDRESRIPDAVRAGLADLGLFGLIFPEEHGGMGLGMRAYVRVFDRLSWECVAVPTLIGGHLSLCGRGLLLYGSEEQKRRWLPPMCEGSCVGAFALTEANAGSDFRSLATRAERVEGGWRLSGTKLWITNGVESGLILTFARTGEAGAPDSLTAFLVKRAAEGLTVGKPEEKMGLHASSTTPVDYEGVFVPGEDVLGAVGQGFEVAVQILNRGRAGWSGACLGAARRALHEARLHAAQREQYGQPILRFGMIREYLAQMAAEVAGIDALSDLVAGLTDRGGDALLMESAALKIYATEALGRVTDLALQVAGGNGFSREYPYERMVRDARVSRIFEGTNEVLRMLIGRQLAGAAVAGEDTAPPLEHDWSEHAARLSADAGRLRTDAARLQAELGREFRFAESHHRRLADRSISIAVRTAILLRRAAEPDWEDEAVLRYALLLQERLCRAVEDETAAPLDQAMGAAADAVST